VLTQDWQLKYNSKPIIRREQLALTPMVFVFWQERYQAFSSKYPQVSFTAIDHAVHESGGWRTIAGKGEWGLFKFGHTHPNESNSGLAALYLMLCEYSNKSRELTLADVVNPEFNSWLTSLKSGFTGLSNSTGNMMREMVLRGPSSYHCLFVYESVVLDCLKNAEGCWEELRVIHPKLNIWNDNPYCILDVPWSSEEQKKAAGTFLDFLMSEQIQRASLDHGFRPGNPNVPSRFPDSPFVKYESSGLKVDLGTVCDPPKAEVITNLLA
jgi:ABC-type Fe3+ transport system substrate-binding protein